MLKFKNLVLAAEAVCNTLPEQVANQALINLKKAATHGREFLEAAKSFEYEGKLTMKYATTIKLVECGMDLDDVIKNLMGKKTDIEADCQLVLVLSPLEPETTKTEKAA